MPAVTRKRPIIVSVITVLAMVGCFFALMASIMPAVKKLGDYYPAILGFIVAMRFIALVGVWHMKRWGVHFFVYAFLLRIVLYILMADIGIFGMAHLFFCVLYAAIFFVYYRRMDANL